MSTHVCLHSTLPPSPSFPWAPAHPADADWWSGWSVALAPQSSTGPSLRGRSRAFPACCTSLHPWALHPTAAQNTFEEWTNFLLKAVFNLLSVLHAFLTQLILEITKVSVLTLRKEKCLFWNLTCLLDLLETPAKLKFHDLKLNGFFLIWTLWQGFSEQGASLVCLRTQPNFYHLTHAPCSDDGWPTEPGGGSFNI